MNQIEQSFWFYCTWFFDRTNGFRYEVLNPMKNTFQIKHIKENWTILPAHFKIYYSIDPVTSL